MADFLPFDHAVEAVAGFGYVVLMDANAEQKAAGIDYVASVKADNHILGSYALDAEFVRKFRMFRRILQRRPYPSGEVVWLAA